MAKARITFTDSVGAATLESDYPEPGCRFAGWTPKTLPQGQAGTVQGTLARVMNRTSTRYGATFEVRGLGMGAVSGSALDVADRLAGHLLKGGTCSVFTEDIDGSEYDTCGLMPGTAPVISQADAAHLEYTLALSLINLADSPVAMNCHYDSVSVPEDIADLIAALGGDSVVAGIFDARYGVTTDASKVTAWRDARGPGYATLRQATGTKQPAYDGSGIITFDGVDDFLTSTDARVTSNLVGASAMAYTGTLPAIDANTRVMMALVDSAHGHAVLYMYKTAASSLDVVGDRAGNAEAVWGTVISGVRAAHGRRTAVGGGSTTTAGARVGAAAEATDGGTAVDDTPDVFAVGANSAGALATGFAVRAVILYKGTDWTSAAKYAVWNAWAAAQHGATI